MHSSIFKFFYLFLQGLIFGCWATWSRSKGSVVEIFHQKGKQGGVPRKPSLEWTLLSVTLHRVYIEMICLLGLGNVKILNCYASPVQHHNLAMYHNVTCALKCILLFKLFALPLSLSPPTSSGMSLLLK